MIFLLFTYIFFYIYSTLYLFQLVKSFVSLDSYLNSHEFFDWWVIMEFALKWNDNVFLMNWNFSTKVKNRNFNTDNFSAFYHPAYNSSSSKWSRIYSSIKMQTTDKLIPVWYDSWTYQGSLLIYIANTLYRVQQLIEIRSIVWELLYAFSE